MVKMSKSISMNGRARSTSKTNKFQDWQGRTSQRSFSKTLVALIKSGPREPELKRFSGREKYFVDKDGKRHLKDPVETKIEALIEGIKKCERRIARLKAFGTPPTGRETKEDLDRAAKILKEQGIFNRLIANLQDLNLAKQIIDSREDTKRVNREAVQANVHVKMNGNEYKPKKESPDQFIPSKVAVPVQRVQIIKKGGRTIRKVLMTDSKAGELIKIERRNTEMKERAERKERLKRLSMAELVREERLQRNEKTYAPEIQAKIDEVFGEDDFENMLKS